MHYRQTGDHARGAVEVAAVGHRIQVRAGDPAVLLALGACQRQVKVASVVNAVLHAQRNA